MENLSITRRSDFYLSQPVAGTLLDYEYLGTASYLAGPRGHRCAAAVVDGPGHIGFFLARRDIALRLGPPRGKASAR